MRLLVLIMVCLGIGTANAQRVLPMGTWRVQLVRSDGNHIVFNFEVARKNNKTVLYILNATERMLVDNIRMAGDSVFIQMPVFESQFRAQLVSGTRMEGIWTRSSSRGLVQMPFIAEANNKTRFPVQQPALHDVSGRWAVDFKLADKSSGFAVGEFTQRGNTLTGTMLTSTGDYRYLGGVVTGDSFKLSTFDGVHAFLFTGKVNSDRHITGGHFYSGPVSHETWTAEKNAKAVLPDDAAMYLKEGEERLNFSFYDLNKNKVSINDPRYKNKVVVVQILGSWCPNCMDETAFLSDYYKKNRNRGVEVIGLAYEYSTDFERSKQSLMKFKNRFDVQYPILITGVTVSDPKRTEKTLPQVTTIKSFPSTIFLDKQGHVARLHAGFSGPGTGQHYEDMKREFAETIDQLLK